MVEAAVKTAKTLQKKASEAHRDQWLNFLDYRNTPTEGMDSSPVQRLMSKLKERKNQDAAAGSAASPRA